MDSEATYVVGVDLGGSKILTAVAASHGEILGKVRLPTGVEEGERVIFERIFASIEEAVEQAGLLLEDVAGVGIGSPGFLSGRKGVVYFAGNLNWENVELCDIVARKFRKPVWLDNDANLAALAENLCGAGRGRSDMVYITVSTGIGCGIILGGEIEHGSGGLAGELGHTTIVPDGPRCNCGNHGCLEVMASGTALVRRAREMMEENGGSTILELAEGDPGKITGPLVTEAAERGDPMAGELFAEIGGYLGIGVANVINLYNPELVVIGGGVSRARRHLFPPMVEEVESRVLRHSYEQVEIVSARLGDEVGVVGAICLALRRLRPVSDDNVLSFASYF